MNQSDHSCTPQSPHPSSIPLDPSQNIQSRHKMTFAVRWSYDLACSAHSSACVPRPQVWNIQLLLSTPSLRSPWRENRKKEEEKHTALLLAQRACNHPTPSKTALSALHLQNICRSWITCRNLTVDSRKWWYSLIRTLHLRSVCDYTSGPILQREEKKARQTWSEKESSEEEEDSVESFSSSTKRSEHRIFSAADILYSKYLLDPNTREN